MYLVRAVLPRREPGLCQESDIAILMDAMWAHATEVDGLEHIRGRRADGSVEMILFLLEPAELDPELRAVNLITSAFRHSAAVRAAFGPTPHVDLCSDISRSLT